MKVKDCYDIVNGAEFSINAETGAFTNFETVP